MTWESSAAIFSALFAGVGLCFSAWAVYESNKTRQLQLLNESFRNIHEKEILLYKEYKNKDKQTKKEWDSLLFNSIEQFAFLVNNKYIGDRKMTHFFDDAVVKWYEEIFLKNYTKKEIKDASVYPEFKKLYSMIKGKKEGSTMCKIPVKQAKIVVSTMAGALLGVAIDRLMPKDEYWLWLIPIGVLLFIAFILSKMED